MPIRTEYCSYCEFEYEPSESQNHDFYHGAIKRIEKRSGYKIDGYDTREEKKRDARVTLDSSDATEKEKKKARKVEQKALFDRALQKAIRGCNSKGKDFKSQMAKQIRRYELSELKNKSPYKQIIKQAESILTQIQKEGD